MVFISCHFPYSILFEDSKYSAGREGHDWIEKFCLNKRIDGCHLLRLTVVLCLPPEEQVCCDSLRQIFQSAEFSFLEV